MKKLILLSALLSTSALAWDNPAITKESEYSSNSNSTYKSDYGNNYKYDLTNQNDRRSYGNDRAAQIRDSVDVNPYKSLERDRGQYGAGRLK
jgi:hypothetical protein